MQPLYTEQEFKEAKSRQLLPLLCLHCKQTFFKTKHDIQQAKNPKQIIRHQRRDFCSQRCQRLHSSPMQNINCNNCHIQFKRNPCQISKSKHHFCSQSCAAKYSNTHKTKGTRISKLEKWLQVQLPILYPSLEFHFNRKDAINGELDIYIPSLKLAFELNGIFHYEPIYGKEKLASIQTNDHRKILACAEQGIELCIVDASSLKYFKEQKAIKFLKIIQNIIDLKSSRY